MTLMKLVELVELVQFKGIRRSSISSSGKRLLSKPLREEVPVGLGEVDPVEEEDPAASVVFISIKIIVNDTGAPKITKTHKTFYSAHQSICIRLMINDQ